jgi:nitronate monooxygenase
MQLPAVMQAPIGPASTVELVTAVGAAGGLGCLAASWTPLPRLRDQVRRIRAALDGPFCVNLVLAFDQRERLELLVEERVPAISFSWGVDAAAIARAHGGGATVLVQVGDPAAAVAAAAAGADVVIAQGVEAGGHVQSSTPLLELLAAVRGRVRVPLLAAGGIAGPAAARAARAAGADGVVAGTAFLATQEADVHPHYLARVLAAGAGDAVLTGLFDGGWPDAPHRVLRNSTWRTARAASGSRPGAGETVATIGRHAIPRYSDAQPTRAMAGDIEAMALYAGAGVGEVRRSERAADITRRLLGAG